MKGQEFVKMKILKAQKKRVKSNRSFVFESLQIQWESIRKWFPLSTNNVSPLLFVPFSRLNQRKWIDFFLFSPQNFLPFSFYFRIISPPRSLWREGCNNCSSSSCSSHAHKASKCCNCRLHAARTHLRVQACMHPGLAKRFVISFLYDLLADEISNKKKRRIPCSRPVVCPQQSWLLPPFEKR